MRKCKMAMFEIVEVFFFGMSFDVPKISLNVSAFKVSVFSSDFELRLNEY